MKPESISGGSINIYEAPFALVWAENGRFLFEKKVWLFAAAAGRNELGSKVNGYKPLKNFEQQLNYMLSMAIP